jgi:hypothetical protein
LTALLASLAALLLIVIGFETGWGRRLLLPAPGTGPVKAAAIDAKLLPPIVATSPEGAYPETGARPLFTPTRRPAPQAAAAANMVKGQFVLHGVTIVGELRIAMLKEKSSGRTVRAEKGREVNGMTVAEIEADRVTLRLGDDAETLPLTVQRGTGAPPAAAIATPLGPFGLPAAPAAPAPVAKEATGRQTTIPGAPTPVPPRNDGFGPAPPGTAVPIPVPTPATRAADPSAPASAAEALTPEELLARRRARRPQQGTP